MTAVQTRDGVVEVDRDFLPVPVEDVALRLPEELVEGITLTLSADEADELADALKHHAAEVRQINKENGLA